MSKHKVQRLNRTKLVPEGPISTANKNDKVRNIAKRERTTGTAKSGR